MYLNKVQLYGNLTRDPEIKALPSGQQVANFAIATNRSFKNKEGQRQEQTEFHNVVAFGRTAEVIGQYLKKGRPIFVEGRLQTRTWEAEGKKNYRTEVIVENFQFGADGGRGEGATGGANRASAPVSGGSDDMDMPGASDSIQYPDEEINPEDIPF